MYHWWYQMHQRHFWCYLPLLPLKNDRTSTNHEARKARGHICHRSWAFQRPSTMTFQCWTAPSAGASGVQLKGGSSRTADFFLNQPETGEFPAHTAVVKRTKEISGESHWVSHIFSRCPVFVSHIVWYSRVHPEALTLPVWKQNEPSRWWPQREHPRSTGSIWWQDLLSCNRWILLGSYIYCNIRWLYVYNYIYIINIWFIYLCFKHIIYTYTTIEFYRFISGSHFEITRGYQWCPCRIPMGCRDDWGRLCRGHLQRQLHRISEVAAWQGEIWIHGGLVEMNLRSPKRIGRLVKYGRKPLE